ncbi:hypothetical protein ASPWEDRAFT_440942 [Aspergillus wentii DTO 134E9]|uniref:Uncharacterized protein n=1 Tax=Aspergillus wentii DTO 134E9 TaxID=1073089 RepID=A0A1L9RQC8_ASPWE|nr:uncharacterized protein ASPWEDRAFT_440942 [Aspergillus wentii DTO 134E9]KAI9928378.1 hypothetical protein MW887_002416 [Aspergillus wentii]OJJ37134.1 hypothetical protein ASPWEDRAFT_440942 [Aspergillus wentii DTO 134E9]
MRSMDALGAFSHLSDNVPSWINRVSELAAYTAAKNAEYSEAYKKYSKGRKPRRRKNSSVCSIHTEDLDKPTQDQEEAEETEQTEETAGETGSAENPLKRGCDDAFSGTSDGPLNVVSLRHNVIIHYDGHTQQTLEELVRDIGTARNNIRKGKMSQLSAPSLRPGMRNMRPPPSLPGEADSPAALLPNIRSARNRGPPKGSPFDAADKHLELAHSMCETAAYQFLRVGTCSTELSSVEGKLTTLQRMATSEVERLREEQKQNPREEETPNAPAEDDKPLASADGAIEVDDSSDVSVESIDLTAFRANRNRYRA